MCLFFLWITLKRFTKALGALLTGLSPFIFSTQGRPGPKGDPGDAGLTGQKVSVALESSPSLRGEMGGLFALRSPRYLSG